MHYKFFHDDDDDDDDDDDHAVISYSFVNVVVLYNGTIDVCTCLCLSRTCVW